MSTEIHKIREDIVLTEQGINSIMTIQGAAVSTSDKISSAAKLKEPADSSSVRKTKPWSIWGDSDDWPQQLMEKLDQLGVAKRALDLNSDLHFGTGVIWMKEETSEDGTLKHIVSNPKGWKQYCNRSKCLHAQSDVINAKDTFGWGAVRFTLNGMDGVYKLEALDIPSSRLGFRNKAGKIESLYYAQDIHLLSAADDTVQYPVYDDDNHDEFIKKNKVFVYLVHNPSWGRFYYGEPHYYATIRNGWADIAIEVPKLIKNIYKNQATLKYHIKVPITVFRQMYAGSDPAKCWDMMTQEQQLEAYKSYKKEIQDVISKAEAAGSSVFTLYEEGKDKVEITPIDASINTTKDLPNNTAANSEILFAIGIDPSLLGLNMPGGKDLNGGGGSQRRESLKIKQATFARERLDSLGVMFLLGRLNKYDEDSYPMYAEIDVSQTLDENPTGKKNVVGV
jgi:hypothetical protein